MNNIDPVRLRRLDLNSLAALHTLLTTRSVSRSAEQLCLGQPAVSHILKQLRATLGDELLCRYGRGMTLTPLAEALLEPLTQWLEQGQRLLQAHTDFDPARVDAVFPLAMPDLLEAALLPALIGRLQRCAPGLVLEVVAMPGQDVEGAIESARIASAIGYFPQPSTRLVRQPLFEARFVCLYNPARLTLPPHVELARLATRSHVLTSYMGNSASLVDTLFREQGLSRRAIASTASLLAIPDILRELPAVAVLPDIIAAVVQHYGSDLAMAPISDERLRIRIEQVWHPRLNQDRLHRFVREQTAAEIAVFAAGRL
jgi:DNA-binding transcriptional LysR family regulator